MTDKITIARFVRDTHSRTSNLHVITFVFELDYIARTVSTKWAITNGDNFNKKVGVEIAKNKQHAFTFNLDKFKESGLSLTRYAIENIMRRIGKDPWVSAGPSMFGYYYLRIHRWKCIVHDLNTWTRKQSGSNTKQTENGDLDNTPTQ